MHSMRGFFQVGFLSLGLGVGLIGCSGGCHLASRRPVESLPSLPDPFTHPDHQHLTQVQAIQANPPGQPPGAQQAPTNPAEAEMAAAVAAAVAAAGPLPQPVVKHEPAAAGRGAEGALGSGLWAPSGQHGAPPKPGSLLNMYETWQAKPLGQARMAAHQPPAAHGMGGWSGAPAAAAAAAAVKEEPAVTPPRQAQQQQQQQLMQHFGQAPAPVLQYPPAPAAPGPSQHEPAPGYFVRPPSAGVAIQPGAVQQLHAALAAAPVAAWAQADIQDCQAFLQQQGE